mgnify:CR=1 FL=1
MCTVKPITTVHPDPRPGGQAADLTFAGTPREVDADIMIPVYNEQAELASSVMLLSERLRRVKGAWDEFSWQVVIADNASSDATWRLATRLAEAYPDEVRAVRLTEKGRGRALKRAWSTSRARVRAYMDVDLSTDIEQVPDLILPVLDGEADVCFGSRLLPESQVTRCLKRELISRTYNRMLRAYLGVKFRDAQCGFKAVSAGAAKTLLPAIVDNEWFFDTELLYLAEACGMRTKEVAVRWVEDAGSTVRIADTVKKDLAGMYRLRHGSRRRAAAGEAAPKAGSAGTALRRHGSAGAL